MKIPIITLLVALFTFSSGKSQVPIYVDHTPIHPWPQDGFNGGGNLGSNYSPALAKVQKALKGLGYYRGTVDGEFGRGTATAIQQYQNDNGLNVTGRLDNATLATLNRPNAAPRSTPIQPIKDTDNAQGLPPEVNKALIDAIAQYTLHNYAVKDAPMIPVIFRPTVLNVQGGYAFYKGTPLAVGEKPITDVLAATGYQFILKDVSGGTGTKWEVIVDASHHNPTKDEIIAIKSKVPQDTPDAILEDDFKAMLRSVN